MYTTNSLPRLMSLSCLVPYQISARGFCNPVATEKESHHGQHFDDRP